jgi:hypothetical protein
MATIYMTESTSEEEASELRSLRQLLLDEKKKNSELHSQLDHARDELFKVKKELKEEREKGFFERLKG